MLNFDTHIAIYILPYVVLHVLQDGSDEDINEVKYKNTSAKHLRHSVTIQSARYSQTDVRESEL